MGVFGLVDPSNVLSKLSGETKRNRSLPFLMLNADRVFIHFIAAVPSLILTAAVLLGDKMYSSNSLVMMTPTINGSRPFDRWYDQPAITEYCWSQMKAVQVSPNGQLSETNIWHYSMFPYVMVMFCLIPLLANLAWRVMDLDELAHALDFIIDGVEESIQDTVAFLVKRAKSNGRLESPAEATSMTENTAFIQPNLYKDYVSSFKVEKFHEFNLILNKYSKQAEFRLKLKILRIVSLCCVLIENCLCYYIYLVPERNPVTFGCYLPRELQISSGQDIGFFVFSPVTTRSLLLWAMFFINLLVLVFGLFSFFLNPKAPAKNPGVQLIENLPQIDDDLKFDESKDLLYILSLVHTNRFRYESLRFGFHILAVSNLATSDSDAKHQEFLKAMRESALWEATRNSSDEIIAGINQNVKL